jgi:hypothetical protein
VLPLIIMPLVSYSVLVSILLAMAYLQPKPPHPMEMMRDEDGVNQPARKVGAKEHVQRVYRWGTRLTMPLPDKLKVQLGNSVVVGDLKVTPLEAEMRPIMFYYGSAKKPDESQSKTLVLLLELENISSDVAFCPLDPYFDRRFNNTFQQDNFPFTYLEKEGQRFFGAATFPTKAFKDNPGHPGETLELQGVDGDPKKKLPQNTRKELMPGEKFRTFVACNADDDTVAKALQGYTGPLLYRIRVRRGLVPFKGQEVSASAVIGVEFTGKDVKTPG